MNPRKLFFPLLAVCAIAGVGLGGFLEQSSKRRIDASFADNPEVRQLKRQTANQRLWRETAFQKEWALSGTEGTPLFGPLIAKASKEGELYLLDSGDLSIKRFDPKGNFVRMYGEGRGQGPGEFSGLTDFAISPAGEVWTVDPNNGRLSVFEPEGRLSRTVRLESPPYRLALDTSGFNLMFMPSRPAIFGRFGSDDNLDGAFGTFLKDQGINAMLLDGWVAPDPRQGFVYAARFAGLLAAYDAAGRQRFLTETLDRPPLPKIIRGTKGQTWVDRESRWAAAGLSVTSNEIHVLSYFQSGIKKIGSIDAYDLRDGSYRYSRRVPEPCQSIFVTDDAVYAVKDTTVTKWSFSSSL